MYCFCFVVIKYCTKCNDSLNAFLVLLINYWEFIEIVIIHWHFLNAFHTSFTCNQRVKYIFYCFYCSTRRIFFYFRGSSHLRMVEYMKECLRGTTLQNTLTLLWMEQLLLIFLWSELEHLFLMVCIIKRIIKQKIVLYSGRDMNGN